MHRILLGLTLAPKVGWNTIQKLIIDQVDHQCYGLGAAQWQQEYPYLSEEQAKSLSVWLEKERLLEYEQKLKREHIFYTTIEDEYYPPLLKEIAAPPWILFGKGDVSLIHQSSLGVVGSRKKTPYSQMVTQKITEGLVQNGWVIVSGLALGIDASAHEVTLKHAGKTIAVLGSGIDVIYPKHNRRLYEKIEENGLIVSEYPPGTTPHPSFFPQRNRLIAGLSYGVIVIAAAKKSGSLITAQYALESGREVFAVPGSIFEHQSVGTNLLIQQQGAKLITNIGDVEDELAHIKGPRVQEASTGRLNEDRTVDDIEKKILEVLKYEKKHMNEIHSRCGLSFSELNKVILKMEMKGLIASLPGSYYQRY